MKICKYCNKPIAEKDIILNIDYDGNGYHHECLIDMEFKARDRQIYNKGKIDVLDKIRAEIEQKIEQERFARSVFRGEEKDAVKAEQCTGSIFAYNNVIKLIDKYRLESEGQ